MHVQCECYSVARCLINAAKTILIGREFERLTCRQLYQIRHCARGKLSSAIHALHHMFPGHLEHMQHSCLVSRGSVHWQADLTGERYPMTKRRWNLSLIFTWARCMKFLWLGNAFGQKVVTDRVDALNQEASAGQAAAGTTINQTVYPSASEKFSATAQCISKGARAPPTHAPPAQRVPAAVAAAQRGRTGTPRPCWCPAARRPGARTPPAPAPVLQGEGTETHLVAAGGGTRTG